MPPYNNYPGLNPDKRLARTYTPTLMQEKVERVGREPESCNVGNRKPAGVYLCGPPSVS
jgi:hypothetical protein